MLKKSKQQKYHCMGIVISVELRKKIALLATQETRSLSSMIRVLLEESINRRIK